MTDRIKGFSILSKGILTFIFVFLSFGAYAEDTVTFLGEETTITDRSVRYGFQLSEYLEAVQNYCLAEGSSNHRTNRKHRRKNGHGHHGSHNSSLNKQISCLKKFVQVLRKHNRHRSSDITRVEWRELRAIIDLFKENGGVIGPVDPEPVVLVSTVNGRITQPNGEVVVGAVVTVVGSDVTGSTDDNGSFSLELDADAEYVLQLTADSFANQVVPVKSPTEDGVINLEFTMIAKGAVQEFSAETGDVLFGENGAAVNIQPNSFVDAAGDFVTGNIELTITPVDVSNPSSLAAFPGEFTGTTATGDTPIISFGTVEYVFTKDGNPIQLAEGVEADILIPIYIDTNQDGTDIVLGQEIPLWSLNEETGIWLQEGSGTVISSLDSPTGLAMEATVGHFTWWNCDVSMDSQQAIVTVIGQQAGTAVVKATTSANIGSRPGTVDTVLDLGVASSPLFIPNNAEVCFIANVTYVDGSSGITNEVCVDVQDSAVTIELSASQPGPLNIVANGSDGPINVEAFSGYSIDRVRLYPLTTETNVSYSIVSGILPLGLSLNTINGTTAEIVGTSTAVGIYSVTVQASDTDSTTDMVVINIEVTSDEPPPAFDRSTIFLYANPYLLGVQTFNMNQYSVGGQVTTWGLDYNIRYEDSPPPPQITIDPNTGVLSISSCINDNGYNIYWYGEVSATNSAGNVKTRIQVRCQDLTVN